MRFKAEYYNRKTGETYWRTVTSDTLQDAMKISDRYARKGFIRLILKWVF